MRLNALKRCGFCSRTATVHEKHTRCANFGFSGTISTLVGTARQPPKWPSRRAPGQTSGSDPACLRFAKGNEFFVLRHCQPFLLRWPPAHFELVCGDNTKNVEHAAELSAPRLFFLSRLWFNRLTTSHKYTTNKRKTEGRKEVLTRTCCCQVVVNTLSSPTHRAQKFSAREPTTEQVSSTVQKFRFTGVRTEQEQFVVVVELSR